MTATALITGCSSGFGLATAKLFLARGWNVIATMRTPRPELFESSDRLLVAALDVTTPARIAAAVEEGIARFGQIDALVNNAGIGLFGAAEATPDDVIRQTFETNTFGVMAVTRALVPHMRERGSGTMVMVTSSVVTAPMPLLSIYAASKFATDGFSEALAHELRPFGVRVKIVRPGYAPTTSFTANTGSRMEGLTPDAYAGLAGRLFGTFQSSPLGYTTTDDVAKVVFSAATDADDRLRYAAGADSVTLAEQRSSMPETAFLHQFRALLDEAQVA